MTLSREHLIYPTLVGITLIVAEMFFGFIPKPFERKDFKVEVEACVPDVKVEAEVINKDTGKRTPIDVNEANLTALVDNRIRLVNVGRGYIENSRLNINFMGATDSFDMLEIMVFGKLGSPPKRVIFNRSKQQPLLGDLLNLELPLFNPNDYVDIVFYTNQQVSTSIDLSYKGQTIKENYSKVCNVSEPEFGGALLLRELSERCKPIGDQKPSLSMTCNVGLEFKIPDDLEPGSYELHQKVIQK